MPANGRTEQGRITYPAPKIESEGKAGGEKESAPKAAQVAAMGGKDPGTGKKVEPGEMGNGTVTKGDDTQPDTRGTSVEEQRRRAAQRFYPSSSGSRFSKAA